MLHLYYRVWYYNTVERQVKGKELPRVAKVQREVIVLVDNQETTDKYTNALMHINGDWQIRWHHSTLKRAA